MLNRFIRLSKICIFIIALLAFSFSASCAEEETENLSKELYSYVRFMPSAGVSAMSGKVQMTDASTGYSYDFKAFDKLPVELSLETKYIGIKNTTRVSLPPHLTRLTFGLETTFPFLDFNDTYLRLKLMPSFYSQEWNFESSGFRLPTHSFLIYKPNDKWTYIVGVAVYPDFETEVFPILGFIYKPNDKWTFNIVPDDPNISYMVNNKLSVFGEGSACWDEFEVTRGDSENVVLINQEKHLGAGLEYKFNKFMKSRLSVGGVFGRSLKYRDDEGKLSVKNGLYTEFRVSIQI